MLATTEQPIAEETERQRRHEARERLKEAVKKENGYIATILCMAISHARGKLHCKSYRKYHGGWRTETATAAKRKALESSGGFDDEAFRLYARNLGSGCEDRWARYLYAKSIIESLDDQRDFLRAFIEEQDRLQELFKQVGQRGRRDPHSWERPILDADLHEICRRIADR